MVPRIETHYFPALLDEFHLLLGCGRAMPSECFFLGFLRKKYKCPVLKKIMGTLP
jgi:hypothetical protein